MSIEYDKKTRACDRKVPQKHLRPGLFDVENGSRQTQSGFLFSIPKGLINTAQGCPAGLPWVQRRQDTLNSERVVSARQLGRPSGSNNDATPSELGQFAYASPRVGRSGQPWAELRIPFGERIQPRQPCWPIEGRIMRSIKAEIEETKQIKREVRQMRATIKKIASSPESARRFLISTGMYTCTGKLKPQFR